MKYQRLVVACSLCRPSLKEAARGLTPSSIYTVCVSQYGMDYYDAKQVCATSMEMTNPFAPYINLKIDPELGNLEWYVQDQHGKSIGSEGC